MATVLASVLLASSGCASKRPVLYPNDYYNQVGSSQADTDIATCEEQAKTYASANVQAKEAAKNTAVGGVVGAAGGAVGGAIGGNAGEGAAIGAGAGAATGLLATLFQGSQPSSAYMNWVDHCLQEKGYQPVGWE